MLYFRRKYWEKTLIVRAVDLSLCLGIGNDTFRAMPPPPPAPPICRQLRVPLFPREAKPLGEEMSVVERDGSVWYFHFDRPVFSHATSDLASFRMFTSTLCDHGHCKLVDVERTFSVSAISVKRALKQYREQGVGSFFAPRAVVESQPRVLTEERSQEVQLLLDAGLAPRAIGERLGIKADTIRRAILAGRLHRPKKGGCQISR